MQEHTSELSRITVSMIDENEETCFDGFMCYISWKNFVLVNNYITFCLSNQSYGYLRIETNVRRAEIKQLMNYTSHEVN